MQGAALKNIRRTGIPATKKGVPNPDYAEAVCGLPTKERIIAAGQDYTLGGDARTGRRYVMQDTPLDRAHRKGIISGAEHSALQKFRHHWYHAGQAPHIGSVDLNRIFTAEPGSIPGMPKAEGQVFHRERWRQARAEIGDRSTSVVECFVCAELSLELCGQTLGWTSKPQSIAAAAQVIRDSGYRLAKLWGIG